VQKQETSTKRWIAAFAAWTLLCAAAFVALGDAEDSSRPVGRISPYQAEIAALEHLRSLDASAFAKFETVDAAIYRDRSSGKRIWLVLCDDETPSELARAVVVEIDATSAQVLRTRRPGGLDTAGERAR
jgi:hypothetical protein